MNRQAWSVRLGIAIGITLLASGASHACRAPPAAQVPSADQQLAGARDVSVARVVRATPLEGRGMSYDFEVLRRLSGPERREFSIRGSAPPPGHRPIVTDDHDDPRFLQPGGGRLVNEPDCVLRPHFTVGEAYLVFLDQPAGWRSFEHIASTNRHYDANDRWLLYVEANLGSRRRAGQASPAPERAREENPL